MGYKKTHLDCPYCGHHGCYTEYGDGSTYCFSCGRATNPEGQEYDSDEDTDSYRYPAGTPDPSLLANLPALEYRESKSRGLTLDTIRRYQIGVHGNDVYFPYYREGQIVGVKIKHPPGSEIPYSYLGDKNYATLFGAQTCLTQKAICITEGELDAASVFQMLNGRMGCVSIPFGAPSALRYIKRELEWLETFDKVYICFDQDAPGRKAAAAVMELLEPGKAYNVVLPCKDANEFLTKGLPDFFQYVYSAQCKKIEGIWDGRCLKEAALSRWRKEDDRVGISTGWKGLDNLIGGFRPGEVIVLAAGTGQGKSSWARMLAFNLMERGHRVFYTPLEDDAVTTVLNMASILRQFNFIKHGGKEVELSAALDWVTEHLVVSDQVGYMGVEEYITQARYANRVKRCRFLILDHLTAMVDGTGDETRLMGLIMNGLRQIAREFNLTVIAISHISRDKDDPDQTDPTLSRLKWASSIEQVADFVLGISRKRDQNIVTFNTLKASRTWAVTGYFLLSYDPQTMRMVDYEPQAKPTKGKQRQSKQTKEGESTTPEVGV